MYLSDLRCFINDPKVVFKWGGLICEVVVKWVSTVFTLRLYQIRTFFFYRCHGINCTYAIFMYNICFIFRKISLNSVA